MNILRWFFGGQPQWRDTETQTDPPVPAPNRSVTVYRLCKCGVVERAIVRCNDNMPMSEFCARAAITHEQCLLVRDPSAATVGECGIGRSVTVLESLGYAGPTIVVKVPTGHFRIVPFHENMEVVALYNYLQRREGWCMLHQRLLFEGRQLALDEYLSDYNVTPDSTLHLVGRLCG